MKTRLLILGLALCLIATPAFADLYGTVTVDYKGLILGSSQLTLTSPYGSTTEQDVGVHSLDLGALNTASATDPLPGDSFLAAGLVRAFCIDLLNGFPIVTEVYKATALEDAPLPPTPSGPIGSAKALYMAQLLNLNTYATQNTAAAVQVALWEIEYETASAWNVSSGNGAFYLDTVGNANGEFAVATLANGMLAGLAQAASFDQYTALSSLSKNGQDFVVVPIPAAVLLGFLGLGAAGLKLRKFA